ncbi:MAG TPA: STAS domain-containing protein [Gallionella sp.]|nr:STAS domain-containing protein [Gallionella sp.]
MEVHVENGDGCCRIGVDGELTIYTAAQAKESLLAAMAEAGEIEMNLAHVNEIDAAGLQLLALVKREAADRQQSLQFVMHSQAVLDLLDLCNLAGVFGDPVVLSSAIH